MFSSIPTSDNSIFKEAFDDARTELGEKNWQVSMSFPQNEVSKGSESAILLSRLQSQRLLTPFWQPCQNRNAGFKDSRILVHYSICSQRVHSLRGSSHEENDGGWVSLPCFPWVNDHRFPSGPSFESHLINSKSFSPCQTSK